MDARLTFRIGGLCCPSFLQHLLALTIGLLGKIGIQVCSFAVQNHILGLCASEREPRRKRRINRLFSILFTRSFQDSQVSVCLMPASGRPMAEYTLQLDASEMKLIEGIPLLEGVSIPNAQACTILQLRQTLHSILGPPQGSSILTVLLCFSLPRAITAALGLDSIPQLLMRDVGRVPLYPPSLHIPRRVHDLFVNPGTPITLTDPYSQLMNFLNPLHLSCKWINIPIPSQQAIDWVRYELYQGPKQCLIGYVCHCVHFHFYHQLVDWSIGRLFDRSMNNFSLNMIP